MFTTFVDLLLLILIANGTPVIARNLLRGKFSYSLDFEIYFSDRRRVLGPAKTWRGVIASLGFTSLCAYLMGYEISVGFYIALLSLLGDSISSFIKRRLDKPTSSMFLLLDQVPESLLPALVMAKVFSLSHMDVFILVIFFIVAELSLSYLMFRLGIRRRPY